jgi:putative copper export protein
VTTVTLAQIAPATDSLRLSLHVLAASIWVGGQLTLGGLVPVARRAGGDLTKQLARGFARLAWPAYVVLLGTGIWNVADVSTGQSPAWKAVLMVKILFVLLAGIGTGLHTRSTSRRALAIWGAVGAFSSVAALVMGVVLAG